MPLHLPFGTRQFTLRWPWLLLTAAACTLFVNLGFWQWHRGEHRQAIWAAFQQVGPAVPATGRELLTLPRFTRVEVGGELDGAHQILLDNLSEGGRPGYEVLTPLKLADGTNLLVNRGWVPYTGHHDTLPDVALAPSGPVQLRGRLDELPVPGLASGRVPPAATGPWPKLTSFPTLPDLGQALGTTLAPQVLLLDPDSGTGYVRHWQPPGIAPDRNFSYAIQWWAFAAVALGLFVFLNLGKRR